MNRIVSMSLWMKVIGVDDVIIKFVFFSFSFWELAKGIIFPLRNQLIISCFDRQNSSIGHVY